MNIPPSLSIYMHVNNNNIIWSNYTFDIQANQTQYEKLHWYESACKSCITRGLFKPKKSIIDFVGLNSVSEPAMKLLLALIYCLFCFEINYYQYKNKLYIKWVNSPIWCHYEGTATYTAAGLFQNPVWQLFLNKFCFSIKLAWYNLFGPGFSLRR